jgi:hypothetical protein
MRRQACQHIFQLGIGIAPGDLGQYTLTQRIGNVQGVYLGLQLHTTGARTLRQRRAAGDGEPGSHEDALLPLQWHMLGSL